MRKKKNKKTVADTGYKKVDRKEKKKKEKQEEIILCAMYCGKKRNFYLIRQKH